MGGSRAGALPVGRVVKPSALLDDLNPSGREGIILASQKEYADNKDRLRGVGIDAFVNQELHTAGLVKLSADERKTLKA